MALLRIICSDADGWPVEPRCRICQMNATLEEVDGMLDRGCSYEQIAWFIASGAELAVEATVVSVGNHASRRDPIRHSQED